MTLWFVSGLLVGAFVAVVAVIVVMRSRMIEVEKSPLALEETLEVLADGVDKAEGWTSPGIRNLNEMMAKHGVRFEPPVRLFEMCKAPYAAEVLKDNRRMATLMPCVLAVYEDDEGQVWISKMNTGLMGKVFGGTVARVMGGGVAREERLILARLHERGNPAATGDSATA